MNRTKMIVVGGCLLSFMVFGTLTAYMIASVVIPSAVGAGEIQPAGSAVTGFATVATISSLIATIVAAFHKYEPLVRPFLPTNLQTTADGLVKIADGANAFITTHQNLVNAVMAGLDIKSGKPTAASGSQNFNDGTLEWSFKFTPNAKTPA